MGICLIIAYANAFILFLTQYRYIIVTEDPMYFILENIKCFGRTFLASILVGCLLNRYSEKIEEKEVNDKK